MITASLGVSSLRGTHDARAPVEQQKNELLRAADAAMYRAKERGKDAAPPRASRTRAFQRRLH